MNLPITTAVGAFALLTGFSITNTVADFTEAPTIALEIYKVEYSERDGIGYMTQQINSIGGQPISASWGVQISTVDEFGVVTPVCSGSSDPQKPGIYNGDVDIFTIKNWAHEDCPTTLDRSHRAEVKWRYQNEVGLWVSIGTTLQGEDFEKWKQADG